MSIAATFTTPVSLSKGQAEEVIRSAEHELKQLLRQRAETMKRIGTVKQTLVCLAKTFGDDVLPPEVVRLLGRGNTRKQPGFTRACRVILMEAATALEARQGLRELQDKFPHLVEHQKAPLAAVTTVFNRLVAYGEARSFPNGKGRRVWEWIVATDQGGIESLLPSVDDGLAPPTASVTKQ
jgi:hypothetical protein